MIVHAPNAITEGEIILSVLTRLEGKIRARRRVLVRTGWDARLETPGYWVDYPNLAPDAAEWLTDTGVVFLGLDTPSPHRTESRHLHETLFLGEMVLAECLVRLGELQRDEVLLIALPLPLSGLDGSAARIVAVDAAPAALQAWAHL